MLPLTVEDRLNATTDCGGLFGDSGTGWPVYQTMNKNDIT